jgi:RNA polymerase sigma-70 factor (ECF subfamily)
MIEDHVESSETGFADSFERFYANTWQQVYRGLVVGIGDADLARDATDEAMVRAYEHWRQVSGMANPGGWVYRVAANWATSRLRRRRLQRRVGPSWISYDPEIVDPRLLDAVRNLSWRHRDLVIARYLLDLSELETAKALGIRPGTVKSRLSRALAELKEALS